MGRLQKTVCVQIFVFLIITVFSVICNAEQTPENLNAKQVIGVVSLEKSEVTNAILKQLDRLVPAFKKMPSDKIIRLDCNFSGDVGRETDVKAAYTAAGRVEKYLRERHKLKLDLWISAHLSPGKSEKPKLIFSVINDEIGKYQKLPVSQGN